MDCPEDLQAWAHRLRRARESVVRSQRATAAEKRARAASLSARLADWLSTTEAEAHERSAADLLDKVEAAARRAASAWIKHTALAHLASSQMLTEVHIAKLQARGVARERLAKVSHWSDLARNAGSSLLQAQDACVSAGSFEVLDAMSRDMSTSLLSTVATSNARDAITRARSAVIALSRALPTRASDPAIDLPDDFLDLWIDLAIDADVDWLSWFNASQLVEAAKACGRAAAMIAPLSAHLELLADDVQHQAEEAELQLRLFELPILQEAARLVPVEISVDLPQSLAS